MWFGWFFSFLAASGRAIVAVKLFEKKLLTETAFTCGVVAMVTVGIYMVGKIVALLRRAVQGNVPTDGLGSILMLKLVAFLDVMLAPILYVGILLVLTRWSRDREITVYAASGVGPANYVKSALIVTAAALAIVIPLTLIVSPFAEFAYYKRIVEFKHQAQLISFQQGKFVLDDSEDQVVYVGPETQGSEISQLFQVEKDETGTTITLAEVGEHGYDERAGKHVQNFRSGRVYYLPQERDVYHVTEFDTMISNRYSRAQLRVPVEGKTTEELIGSGSFADLAELNWRISKVVMIPVVIFLAFVLGSVGSGKGVGVNLISAVTILFIYSSIVSFAITQVGQGSVLALVFLWGIHGGVLAFAVWMLARYAKNRSPLPSLLQSRL